MAALQAGIWRGDYETINKAAQKDMEQIVNLTAELFQRCAGYHMKYREPLRDSQKWMER